VTAASTRNLGREHWGTRIGLILAMAGNAVGLGNFLRFPVQAAQNGGGTFMIPYFIAFLLLGIPLMWMEWGIGRYGGRFGHGTLPGMFDRLWKHRLAKYVGVLGIVMPLVVFTYYTVIIGWLLGFAFFSLTGGYFFPGLEAAEAAGQVRDYLTSMQDIGDTSMHGGWVGFLFYAITLGAIVWVLARGISGGIEKLALFGMPVLFLFAIILAVRVLTLPGTEAGDPMQGLAFIWTPEWGALGNANVWLAAAGQVFFTLSLGMGTLHTYASFLSKDDDIMLTGLATASTNEFAEVVLGGTIAIPAAVTFFGVAGATAIAGTFDLGIVAMAVVFQGLPGPELVGRIAGFMWFFLLFIAGITSSVALASPAIAFMQEEFGVQRTRAVLGPGCVHPPPGAAQHRPLPGRLPGRVGLLGRHLRAGGLRVHRDLDRPAGLRHGRLLGGDAQRRRHPGAPHLPLHAEVDHPRLRDRPAGVVGGNGGHPDPLHGGHRPGPVPRSAGSPASPWWPCW
jgi:neurotransmitter:Na+ symporter, NSS family